MHRVLRWAGSIGLLAALGTGRADGPKPVGDPLKSAAERLQAINTEMAAAHQKFSRDHQAATTEVEKENLIQRNIESNAVFAKRMLAVAEENPADAASLDPLLSGWGMTPPGPERQKALDLIVKHHVTSDKLARMGYWLVGEPDGEKYLRVILEKNPNRDAQGNACFGLGRELKARAGRNGPNAAEDIRNAEVFFERAATEYANIKRLGWRLDQRLGVAAENELFELRRLSVGQVAPDIEAEDIDGTKFKLSDYRGKVVLLDFWGHW